ncbi:MAG: DUF3990 domain-containing protein [Treponema sp.]|jgi:hypothetical protein|nr:DUF3990 domain-containing protein [Treponema sp.]
MILYHGSSATIETPDISFSRNNTDFGKRFYTTPIFGQAKSWSLRFKRITGYGVVSEYIFDDSALSEISLLQFDEYSDEWLDFIAVCRSGQDSSGYDLVIGGVANDKVFNTLTLYFRDLIEKQEAIKQLRFEKMNVQYCFKNQSVIDKYLKYTGSGELK